MPILVLFRIFLQWLTMRQKLSRSRRILKLVECRKNVTFYLNAFWLIHRSDQIYTSYTYQNYAENNLLYMYIYIGVSFSASNENMQLFQIFRLPFKHKLCIGKP